MPQITLELTTEKIKELVFQLPPSQLVSLADDVSERAETVQMMKLAETGFRDWDEEEDIYEAETTPR